MRFMSFNTQHCRNYLTGEIDFDIMAKAILDCGADVIGLNEMRGEGPDAGYTAQMERLAALTGMHYVFAPAIYVPNKGPYGNGLLSKIPILSADTVFIPDPAEKTSGGHYESRAVLKAELEGGVTVLVTHFGLMPDEQQNAVQTVTAHLTAEKCILMGDFNVTPENPVLAPIRARMQDAAVAFDAEKQSYPSDVPDRKIDYIFASRDARITEADIPAVVASDHRPHLATVIFA